MKTHELLNALKWRYAVKKFDANRKIDESTWNALQETLVLTPSSYGLQPWKFHVVTNHDLKQKLTQHSWKQKQVEECSHLVVFTSKTIIDENYIQSYIESIAKTRNTDAASLEGYKKMMSGDLVTGARSKWIKEWAARQVYIALGNFMTAASLLGVDTCPMEGIIPTEYDKLLNIENSSYQTIVACVAGYRSPEDKYQSAAKVRFDHREMIIKHS
jgi:nitroreductase